MCFCLHDLNRTDLNVINIHGALTGLRGALLVKTSIESLLTFPFLSLSLFQKQAMLVRQLEEEVVKSRQHAKETNPEVKAHIEALQIENDHLTREIAILKETIKVSSNCY